MYGADTSGPNTGDIDRLLSKGEQFEIKMVNGLLTLYLTSMRLKNLGGMANIPGIETVQRLGIAFSQLKNLEGMPAELPALRELYLNGNNLVSLQGMSKYLPALQKLTFAHNQLENLEGMPAELPALSELYLDNNKLVSLQGMSKYLPALKVLEISFNQLKNLQDLPEELPKLKYLFIINSKLSTEDEQEIKAKYPFAVF
jgi:Leucine-rich repeat (LRR) protein